MAVLCVQLARTSSVNLWSTKRIGSNLYANKFVLVIDARNAAITQP